MGGTGFELKATPIDESAVTGMRLYQDASKLVVDNIYTLVGRGRAMAAVMLNYDVDYGAEANETAPLQFGFYDGGGGCFLSMDLLTHWFDLVIASLRESAPRKKVPPLVAWAEARGYRLPPPARSVREEMDEWAKREVFVELRGHYYGASIFEGAPALSSDDFQGRLTYATLSADERVLVDDLLAKHTCACRMCVAFRAGERARAYVPKKAPKPLEGTVSRKKRLQFENVPTMTEVPPEVETAKRLESLSFFRTPIKELPAWLGDRKLESLSLTVTEVTRLPRLPATLRSLTLSTSPLASLEGLELPALETLSLSQLPASAIASLDLRGCPSLRSLWLTSVPIDALPLGLEAAKLDWLLVEKTAVTDLRRACVPSLRTLLLKESPVAELPEAIGDTQLASIQISDAPLRSLPASLARLPKLTTLLLERTALGPWRTWIEHVPPTVKELYVSASVLPASDHGEVKRFLPNATIVSR